MLKSIGLIRGIRGGVRIKAGKLNTPSSAGFISFDWDSNENI
jgi:hypothetical protein